MVRVRIGLVIGKMSQVQRFYFDHNATTPVAPEVLETLVSCLGQVYGNASSIHHFGQVAKTAVDKARHQVAELIRSRPNEIVFTSGGTESNNLAIRGLLEGPAVRKSLDGAAPHIVTSSTPIMRRPICAPSRAASRARRMRHASDAPSLTRGKRPSSPRAPAARSRGRAVDRAVR